MQPSANHSLLDETGKEVTGKQAIVRVIQRYHAMIYEEVNTSTADAAISQLYAFKLRSLTASQAAALEANFTSDELLAALEAERVNDVPGPNGMSPSIYWLAKGAFLPLLLDLANTLLDGKSLSDDLASFDALLEHHSGDRRDLSSYSMLQECNVGRRVIGRAFRTRLHALSGFWPSPQPMGARADEVLESLLTPIRSGEESPAAMITINHKSAMERVDHAYLFRTLEHYGFGPRARSFVKGMLANVTISFPAHFRVDVKVKRGLLQADPASPLLSLVALLPLLDAMEHGGLGASRPQLKVPYLAGINDVVTTFARRPEQLETLHRQLDLYLAATGVEKLQTSVAIVSSPDADAAVLAELRSAWPEED